MAELYAAADDPKTEGTPQDAKDEAKGEPKSALKDSAEKARKWQRELDASKKWLEKFTRTGHQCERAYIDDGSRPDTSVKAGDFDGKVNLFWSNVQVVLSAIYGRLPKAEVDRKFGDFGDDVSRVAALIMQRILNGDMEREYDDTNAAMRDAVADRFISGLGQVWCRYEVETEMVDQPQTDPMTGQPMTDEMGQPVTQPTEQILSEEAAVDYVYWDDFRYSPCRRWRECRWVARRVYMSEDKLKKRFKLTDEQVSMVPMVNRTPGDASLIPGQTDVLKATPFQQAAVWEIWDKEENYACWYVEGCSFILDEQPDPLELDDFFPCPQPAVATTLTRAFIPRADYAMAQDLYKELDRTNAKLSQLMQAVKAAGVYDKASPQVGTLLTTAVENALVPAEGWAAFSEKGGMKGVIDWLPIEQFANVIVQLSQRKQQLERDLYEVLGISDIMRGASVASETLGAQQLKVQYGGARLNNLQNDVARFVSGVMRIRANIVSNHFQPATLVKRSLIDRTPDAPLAQPAVQMLKDFGTALYSITVTADSLAAPDWAAEKDARTEFMGATSNYLMAAGPMVQQNPMIGSFLIRLLQWGAAGFKGSKTIEGVLDDAAKQLEQQAQKPPEPKPPSAADQKDTAQAGKYGADAEKAKADTAQTNLETQIMARQTGLMPQPQPVTGPMGGPGAPAGPFGGPPGAPLPQPPQMPPQGPPGGAPNGMPGMSLPPGF
jgi:hypothetical protein